MQPPCVWCGTDSVATCPSCSRRVCNGCMVLRTSEVDPLYAAVRIGDQLAGSALRLVHPTGESLESPPSDPNYRNAFSSGGPRCMGCRHADGKREIEAVPQRLADEARDRETRGASLLDASDPSQIVNLIAREPRGHPLRELSRRVDETRRAAGIRRSSLSRRGHHEVRERFSQLERAVAAPSVGGLLEGLDRRAGYLLEDSTRCSA